ncbi:MAG: S26 family signal peptidase [Candidatus Levybacteria bacterium]|nr:S26 family signal peptidase [Candidatus Levybacteria bacterium]
MKPTFQNGDLVLACFLAYKLLTPKKGHIVVFRHPRKGIPLIKRVKKIQGTLCFLEGDNLSESKDSRDFGWVKKENIFGKVFYTLS